MKMVDVKYVKRNKKVNNYLIKAQINVPFYCI